MKLGGLAQAATLVFSVLPVLLLAAYCSLKANKNSFAPSRLEEGRYLVPAEGGSVVPSSHSRIPSAAPAASWLWGAKEHHRPARPSPGPGLSVLTHPWEKACSGELHAAVPANHH